jgi:hypothetical protein
VTPDVHFRRGKLELGGPRHEEVVEGGPRGEDREEGGPGQEERGSPVPPCGFPKSQEGVG